jgi:hypothetical protein
MSQEYSETAQGTSVDMPKGDVIPEPRSEAIKTGPQLGTDPQNAQEAYDKQQEGRKYVWAQVIQRRAVVGLKDMAVVGRFGTGSVEKENMLLKERRILAHLGVDYKFGRWALARESYIR